MADVDYVYADLSRAGLGNLLFPWARAVIAADALQVPMLPAKWLKLRLGPYLRGDRDKRAYWKLFTPPPALARARRARLLATATLVSEPGDVVRSRGRDHVLVIDSMAPMFGPIAGHHERIATQLRQMAKPGVLTRPGYGAFVAVHVRLGDFVRPTNQSPAQLVNLSTPIGWFVCAVRRLRTEGWPGPIKVFSDGTDAELRPLLTLGGVTRHRSRNALDDLMIMSRACAIVGSGSSFGAWSAFLGQIPIAVQAGHNHFMSGSLLVHEIATWNEPAPPDPTDAFAARFLRA